MLRGETLARPQPEGEGADGDGAPSLPAGAHARGASGGYLSLGIEDWSLVIGLRRVGFGNEVTEFVDVGFFAFDFDGGLVGFLNGFECCGC